MAGRFRIARKRCIREEDYKSNNRNTDVFIMLILVNSIIFIGIVKLREDPLATGIQGRVISKNPIMCVFY